MAVEQREELVSSESLVLSSVLSLPLTLCQTLQASSSAGGDRLGVDRRCTSPPLWLIYCLSDSVTQMAGRPASVLLSTL